MAIIAAISGAMITTAMTCSASTFADAVNDLDEDFDANKTEEENEAERETSSSSSLENVPEDNVDTANDDVTGDASEAGDADETSEAETGETGEAGETSDSSASEDIAETSEETTTEEEPTITPEAEKKETKKKWFSITIWDILKQLTGAMILMVIPGYYIFWKSKR